MTAYHKGMYKGFLQDPAMLEGVPHPDVDAPGILTSSANTAPTPVPASRDHETMSRVQHARVRVLSVYHHTGWRSAIQDAYLRTGVLERLYSASATLPAGFGLAVLDAWRPLSLQREMYEAVYTDPTLPPGFVAEPNFDPTAPPPHLTGGAVDVTLTWDNTPLSLGTDFDEFSPFAAPFALEGLGTAALSRDLRRLLFSVMAAQGFVVNSQEWWHFEIGTAAWAAATSEPVWYGAADVVLEEIPFTATYRFVKHTSGSSH